MNSFVARNRLILLAYLGMVALLLLTAFFSPGFLSESNLRSTLVLAAFVGIVALGQTLVIIGGGIDLSIPWVLNSAAVLMALLCAGQDLPLIWVAPLILAGGALIGLVNGVGVAVFGVPPIIMTLAANVILQGLILVFTGGSPTPSAPELIKFLAVGRLGPVPVIVLIWGHWRSSRRCCCRKRRSVGIFTRSAAARRLPSSRACLLHGRSFSPMSVQG